MREADPYGERSAVRKGASSDRLVEDDRPIKAKSSPDRFLQDGSPSTGPSGIVNVRSSMKAHARAEKISMYANETIFAALAYNPYFEAATIVVIVLNAAWLCVDVNWNHPRMKDESGKLPLEPASFIVENIFCVYFTFEVLVRFFAFRQKRDLIFDAWFVFDTVLVVMMVVETWLMTIISTAMSGASGGADFLANLSVFRLLRLLRLTRMVRLMKAVPELLTLVKSIFKATKAVSWVLFFLFMVLYVFGILFTVQMSDAPRTPKEGYVDLLGEAARHGLTLSPALAKLAPLLESPGPGDGCDGEEDVLAGDLFATLGDSMMNLFTRGILGDNMQETCDAIKAESDVMQMMFFVFFGLTFVLFLNMLIGVLCEVVSQSSKDEADSLSMNDLKLSIKEAFDGMDINQDGVVCQEEWSRIREQPQVRRSMIGIGMEEEVIDQQLLDMTDLIFQTEEFMGDMEDDANKVRMSQTRDGRMGFTVDQLIDRVLEFRPGQAASALDLEIVKAKVTLDQNWFQSRLDHVEQVVIKALGPRYVDESPFPRANDNFSTDLARMDESEGESDSLPGTRPGTSQDALRQAASVPALEDIPTDQLFRELQRRTAPEPGSNAPIHLRPDVPQSEQFSMA